MRVIEKRASGFRVAPFANGKEETFDRHLSVKGHAVDTIDLVDITAGCHGEIVGHAIIRTANGGIVHAVLIEQRHMARATRAVYLDRESNAFVSIEVPS